MNASGLQNGLAGGYFSYASPSQVFDMDDLAGSAKSSKGCESEISKPEKCNILGLPSQVFDMEDLAGEAKQNNPPAKAAEQKCSSQNVPHGGSLQHCKIFASRMLNRERRPVQGGPPGTPGKYFIHLIIP